MKILVGMVGQCGNEVVEGGSAKCVLAEVFTGGCIEIIAPNKMHELF